MTAIAPMDVSHDARIAPGVKLGRDVRILEGVQIAEGAEIGDRVTLRNCSIAAGVRIEENCIIGYGNVTGGFSHKLNGCQNRGRVLIGEATLIRPGSVIYPGVHIGHNCWINHMVMLREHTHIGDRTSIGTMSDSEGYNSIGSHVCIHSQVHICARTTIEDYVFVAPFTVFTNGNPMNYAREIPSEEQGPTVRFGVQIAASCVILPRVEIGYEAVIGAASTVVKNVPSAVIALGSPARVLKPVPAEQRMPLELRRLYYNGADDPPGNGDEIDK